MKKLLCLILSAALPESCMLYYDAAETGGVSESCSLRLPDGSFEALLTQPFGEGVKLEDFSGGTVREP